MTVGGLVNFFPPHTARTQVRSNGKCDKDLNGYYSKACGWDDGDCLSPGDITGITIGSLFFVVVATCLYFHREKIRTKIEQFRNLRQRLEEQRNRQMQEGIERYQGRMNESGMQEGIDRYQLRQRVTVVFPSAPVMEINEEEPRMDRHTLVLTSIIHKKVVSSTAKNNNGDYEVNILPHETILSERSIRITKRHEMHLHVEDEEDIRKHNEEEDEREDLEAQQSILQRKRDIIVETLRSIRAMDMKCNPNSVESNDNDLYNPKVCPICCDEYEKGDDIAWSRNEECAHAFHTDCIVPWLMENSDCPMCRNDYLCLS